MENDTKNTRKDRLKTLLFQLVNLLRPFTDEEKTLLEKHAEVFKMAHVIEEMREAKKTIDKLMNHFGLLGMLIYDLSLHNVEHHMNDSDFEQFMKDMGETKCH